MGLILPKTSANIRKCFNSHSTIMLELLGDFVGLFFPPSCLACSGPLIKGELTICTLCRTELPRTGYHLIDNNPIEQRLAGRLPIAHGAAFLTFRKKGIVQRLLHQLKYQNHPEVGVMLGRIYGCELRDADTLKEIDLIIPVPLHCSRRKKRGYNQSGAFAAGLSEGLGVPWTDEGAFRILKTSTQTTKSKQERWENVKDVFEVDANVVRGRRILLVDDVMTTGATLEACGRQIVAAGCFSLSVVCIAQAQ